MGPRAATPSTAHATDSRVFGGWPGRVRLVAVVAAVVVLFTAPTFVELYSLSTLTLGIIYVVAAVHLNVALGFAGEFVLHFPIVLGVGAYGAAIPSAVWGWSWLPSILVGTVVGTVVSVVLCLPGLKVRGFYLGVIGLFAVYTFPDFVVLLRDWTGGEDGLAGIQIPEVLGTEIDGRFWFWLMALILVLSVAWTWSLSTSGWGLRLRAMRDARYAGTSSGLSQTRTRLVVYLVSSAPVALCGTVYAFERQFVVPDTFSIEMALLLLAGVIIGGKGTVTGPVLGTSVLVVFQFYVGEFSLWSPIVYGSALLAAALLAPKGLVPYLARIGRLPIFAGRRRASAEEQVPDDVSDDELDESLSFLRQEEGAADRVLEIRGATKAFAGTEVLRGVDLDVGPGAVVGLVGPNGSGKSTLLNLIAGVYAPDGGEIRFCDLDLRGRAHHEMAPLGIGRTFQVPQLINECTARQNVELGLLHARGSAFVADIARTPGARRRAHERRVAATTIVEALGIPAAALRRSAGDMPLGTKRVLEIGRAIAVRPRLLLLDEPTAGLNPDERRAVGRFVRRIQATGISVLVVEHNVSFVMEFCDDVVLLEQGRIVSRSSVAAELSPELTAYLSHGMVDTPERQEIG
ncbi:branched-chain amino acid ABC transporter ATP-binding protein/permease [Pseudonocardia dioxanivorans]|jgi:branched-chain amino acid transport system permease protein|uniref:branched-chain amino acid ABC transporter ATP-binding protein/permease n=1 Tax=Pseudonocardia dioxanivorans TaxID=240495 RepID=UPI000CD0A45A|nr:ATP-binding cassette domain-containing protein [Pseudonocardia dioxanivorans]